MILALENIEVKFFVMFTDGVSEEQLDRAEEMAGLGKFPLDMRCSYRIHNGQRLTSPGYLIM